MAGQNHQSISPGLSQFNLHQSDAETQLCWAGHIIWMGDEHIPKQLFFGELAQGQRKQGPPRNPYKDTLKSSLKWCGIKPSKLNIAAEVHPHWHALTSIASTTLEKEQWAEQFAALDHHHRAASAPATTMAFQSPTCF